MKYSAAAPVKIIVLGAGGTGGYLIPHLYRIAFADDKRNYRIIICDGDIVEPKNLIRQNFVKQDIGRNKAAVLAERYAGAFGIECEYIRVYIRTLYRKICRSFRYRVRIYTRIYRKRGTPQRACKAGFYETAV